MSVMTNTKNWIDKTVLITGVCGTVGREILRQVEKEGVKQVIGIDNNESELFFVAEDYRTDSRIKVFLCDLRDKDKLTDLFRGVDIVIHAAALKHVIMCEESPGDAVQTNIMGVQNIIEAASRNEVQRVLFTSSDKAVNPTNVMGTTKLMGERLMTAANAHKKYDTDPIYASTRFGNVLGSRGSVIPLFKKQIQSGGPLTITDSEMTRFIMTLEGAVSLVLDSVFLAQGGEVFVTKMPVANIADLAHVMVEELAEGYGHKASDIRVDVVGSRPGEKLYEELMTDEEVRRTKEMENFLIVFPAFKYVYNAVDYNEDGMQELDGKKPYNSAIIEKLDKVELREYLVDNNLL